MKATLTISFLSIALLLAACGDADPGALGPGAGNGGEPGPGEDPGTDPTNPTDPTDPALCSGREYKGFDDVPLHAGRAVEKVGVDRARIKPFGALRTEYARVLGNTPASLQGAAATFAQPPARWYEEPQSNAVALQTSYTIAFDGCLTYTQSAPEFAAAPDANSAATQCGAMARKFWSKTPTPQEIQACVDVAVTGAASEPNARRKWAYACASVLSASGFLTY